MKVVFFCVANISDRREYLLIKWRRKNKVIKEKEEGVMKGSLMIEIIIVLVHIRKANGPE